MLMMLLVVVMMVKVWVLCGTRAHAKNADGGMPFFPKPNKGEGTL